MFFLNHSGDPMKICSKKRITTHLIKTLIAFIISIIPLQNHLYSAQRAAKRPKPTQPPTSAATSATSSIHRRPTVSSAASSAIPRRPDATRPQLVKPVTLGKGEFIWVTFRKDDGTKLTLQQRGSDAAHKHLDIYAKTSRGKQLGLEGSTVIGAGEGRLKNGTLLLNNKSGTFRKNWNPDTEQFWRDLGYRSTTFLEWNDPRFVLPN